VIGITLDSNIYISALIFGGKPLRILEMGLDGRADIAISEEILQETLGIMRYKFKLPEERVAQARCYVPCNLGVDSLVVGFYRDNDLIYAARVRAGLVPATRREVFERLKHLRTPKCPFVNLPKPAAGRRG
jgi:hypothetical protein